MKSEYISLTPLGALALFLAGLMLGSVGSYGVPGVAMMLLMLFVVRQDAMEHVQAGTYCRRWCVWRREGPLKFDAQVPA